MDSRPRVIIGNWKMHKTIEEAESFIDDFLASYTAVEDELIGLAVPYTLIYPSSQKAGDRPLLIGAQNINDALEGAFTGEIAAKMVKDAGARFVLLGHSERRRLYGEKNDFINRKVLRAFESDLRPVLCIGETEEEHEAEATQAVLEAQLREGLNAVSSGQAQHLIIAYEPVWAIGVGQSASPEAIQETHRFCRKILSTLYSHELAGSIVLLYGGSVNPSNASDLLSQPDIDGLLIGGASLSLETFLQIVNDRHSKNQSD